MTRNQNLFVLAQSFIALTIIGAAGCDARSEPNQPPAEVVDVDGGTPDAAGPAGEASRSELTPEQCAERGGQAIGLNVLGSFQIGDPGVDLTRDDDCPGSRILKGVLVSAEDSNGALCCEVPPSMTVAQCLEAGGRGWGDPGDGSSYIQGCGGGQTVVGWLTVCETPPCGEGGICCR